MPFNFRVIRSTGTDNTGQPWEYFAMHEVYYDKAEDGTVDETKPTSWSANPIDIGSEEGKEGIRWQLQKMLEALDKPVLELSEMEAAAEERRIAREGS